MKQIENGVLPVKQEHKRAQEKMTAIIRESAKQEFVHLFLNIYCVLGNVPRRSSKS